MIRIEDLEKGYGKKQVLKGVRLEIPDGAIFGLVGINGAGKSTLLRLLAGVMKADKGEILLDGDPVYENETAKSKIFFLPDDPYYTEGMTAERLYRTYATFYPLDADRFEEMMELFRLEYNVPIRNFSKGMRRRLFAALALASRPKVLLLDEAFDGLDPQARLGFKRALIDLNQEHGTTTIIASHSLRELEDITDYFGLLDEGVFLSSGEVAAEFAKYHRFQFAAKDPIPESKLPFSCLSYRAEGKVVQIIVKGDGAECRRSLEQLPLLFAEELELTFEDFFLCNTQGKESA